MGPNLTKNKNKNSARAGNLNLNRKTILGSPRVSENSEYFIYRIKKRERERRKVGILN